jgi:predicted negative regulator of RcsB-dependent stress response
MQQKNQIPMDSVQQSGMVSPTAARRPIFEETSGKAIQAAHRRKWTLVATVGLVVGLIVGLLVYSNRMTAAEDVLVQQYLEIDAKFIAENQAFEERMRANPADYTPTARPDNTESTKGFTEFAKANVKSALGWHAALRASAALIEKQQFAEAQALLDPLLIRTLKHVVFQVRVRKTLAGLLAEQGKFDEAIEQLNFLEKYADNPMVSEVRLTRAQYLYKKGDKEAAAQLLRELVADSAAAVGEGSARSVATEASLWLGYWGL